jgi:hypothetical protein
MLARAWLWRQDVVRVQKIRVSRGDISLFRGEHSEVMKADEFLISSEELP